MSRLALAGLVVAGCSGLDSDPGIDAQLIVAGAQFYDGALPASSSDAKVTSVETVNNAIRAGQINKALSGRVDRAGTAVALMLTGDRGYWIAPTGVMDTNQTDQRDWSARVSFAGSLELGPRELDVSAVDAAGRFGPPSRLGLNVQPHEVDLTATQLVISLSWDTEADLDLHVVVPTDPPITVWAQHPTSYVLPAPGDPVDPAAIANAGILDLDSNSQCQIDGRREENLIWRGEMATPPHGTYTVLVDTFALCAAASAHWVVDIYAAGDPTSLAHATGTVVDTDTRGSHVAGSGVRALSFAF